MVIFLLMAGYFFKDHLLHAEDQVIHGPYTISERLQEYGNTVDTRLAPDFLHANVSYPPAKMTLVILKKERRVELYAGNGDQPQRYIRSYPILAASGHLGPKLRQGDGQVPEGVYQVESLNPNSSYHLALHVNYPNTFDRQKAKLEGRTDPGGDIMIHGSNVSIGCVALGDSAAEDAFVLSAKVGLPNVRLLFCPYDLRTGEEASLPSGLPSWTSELYANLRNELSTLPEPPPSDAVPAT